MKNSGACLVPVRCTQKEASECIPKVKCWKLSNILQILFPPSAQFFCALLSTPIHFQSDITNTQHYMKLIKLYWKTMILQYIPLFFFLNRLGTLFQFLVQEVWCTSPTQGNTERQTDKQRFGLMEEGMSYFWFSVLLYKVIAFCKEHYLCCKWRLLEVICKNTKQKSSITHFFSVYVTETHKLTISSTSSEPSNKCSVFKIHSWLPRTQWGNRLLASCSEGHTRSPDFFFSVSSLARISLPAYILSLV